MYRTLTIGQNDYMPEVTWHDKPNSEYRLLRLLQTCNTDIKPFKRDNTRPIDPVIDPSGAAVMTCMPGGYIISAAIHRMPPSVSACRKKADRDTCTSRHLS